MSTFDVRAVSARLQADPSLATLFQLLREYDDIPAAKWLKGDQELSLTFRESRRELIAATLS